jgi:hypothetical protein
MNPLLDITESVNLVAKTAPKDRLKILNEILAGEADVGKKKKPNRDGIELLHRRALFVTELSKRKIMPA